MMAGLAKTAQTSFAAGAFPESIAQEIPRSGASALVNLLIGDTGYLYRRGGSTYLTASGPAAQIVWVWDGHLASGPTTLAATATTLYKLSGGVLSSVGTLPTSLVTTTARPTALAGGIYFPGGAAYDGTTYATSGGAVAYSQPHLASISNRLVVAINDKLNFSSVGNAQTFGSTDFWLIPDGASTLGLSAIRDSAVWLTDQGIYVVSNMSLNLTDADGNVQQRLDLYSPDLVLWGSGSFGIAGWSGGLVIPARDGVWLVSLGVASEAAEPLRLMSRPIAQMYRNRVREGYRPGQASVSNGHYFLPLVFGAGAGTVAETLVCRLDLPGTPWTVFEPGSASGPAQAYCQTAAGSLIGAPALTGGASKLATMNFFDAADGTKDADGSVPPVVLATRDYVTGSLNANTVAKFRARYYLEPEAGNTPTITAFCGADGAGATANTLTGAAPQTSVAEGTYAWPVGKRGRTMQFELQCTDAGVLVVTSLEMFVRQSSRQ